MADLPEPKNQDPKRQFSKDTLLWVLLALFVVLSIAAMVTIDVVADAKVGGTHEVPDAAEK